MPLDEGAGTLAIKLLAVFIFLLIGIIYFVLNNDAVRMDLIEFSLPVLERFLHQPEMDIVNIFPTTNA